MVKLPSFRGRKYKGQALLLILLVMSVVLSLVLSSVSRSVTDVEVSKYEDDAIRAFDAAQAGIEKSVIVGGATSGTKVELGNSASYTPVIATASATSNFFKYPVDLSSGESAIFFFVPHTINANGDIEMSCAGGGCVSPAQIRLCWGRPGTSSTSTNAPALYIEYFYNSDAVNPNKWEGTSSDLSNIDVTISSADPYTGTTDTKRIQNKFSDADTSGGIPCPASFATAFNTLQSSIPASGRLLFMRVTMLYNDTPQPLIYRSASPLPGQGHEVVSTGQSGDVFRKLVLYRGYPEIPFEFANAIYSKTNLVK